MREIPLYRFIAGHYHWTLAVTRVDDEDYADLIAVTGHWLLHSEGYAYTNLAGHPVMMHRHLLGLTDPKVHTDHRDRDRLNNQRDNIRPCTQAENNQNLPFKGVGWSKQRQKWRAWAPGSPTKHLGLFGTEEEAKQRVAEWIALNTPSRTPSSL